MDPNNARLAKNTGLLYFRMIFLTLINFYAVRVTLEALGEVDLGVYTVVASVVTSLSLLSGAMTSASQRYLSFHLGRNDLQSYSHTFTLLLLAFVVISAIMLVIGESLGYFFIERWLHIPHDRISAAYWVYQSSLVAFIFGFLTIPYTSSIVANERMDAFAAFSIVEGVLKLGIALWLNIYAGDRLKLYGILTGGISVIVFLMSMQYCHSRFKYCKYIWKWDKTIFKQLSQYTGWNLFGSLSGILSNQGQAILLNIYFGPVVNTAKGIADRIQHVIQGFSTNLYMAVSPQIIKSHASGNYQRSHNLVIKTSKLTFMLIYAMSFPIICNINGILNLWLGSDNVTDIMAGFSQLILIYCMVITLEQPITRIIQATGEIKRYQLLVGIITLMYVPVTIIALSLGGSPLITLAIQIAILVIAQIARVIVAHHQVELEYGKYLNEVVYPILKVSFISVPVYLVMKLNDTQFNWLPLLFNILLTGFMGLFTAGFIGLTSYERGYIWEALKNKFSRK